MHFLFPLSLLKDLLPYRQSLEKLRGGPDWSAGPLNYTWSNTEYLPDEPCIMQTLTQ